MLGRRLMVATTLLAGICSAQAAPGDEQETIRRLLEQVQELQQKVAALELHAQPAAQAETPAVVEPDGVAASSQLTVSNSHELYGIRWRGFGDLSYKILDQRTPELGTFGFVPGSAGNFFIGDFDLLLTSRITDKASVLSEVVIGEEDAQAFSIDLERVLFQYEHNDRLKIALGRYHTAIGYYNAAFHSGGWLQTTTDRPLIMEFANDGGLLPTQAVGVSISGEVPSGGWGLNYLLEYGSSDTIRPELNANGIEEDENNGNHINLGLFLRPERFPGLEVGGSIYHDNISDFQRGPSVRLGQMVVNAHIVYVHRGLELLNEGFLLRHAYEHGGLVYNMPAFYTQMSKAFGHIRPYFRYQYINAHPKGIFEDVGLRHGPSFGARYDFNDNIGFKAQLDHTVRKDQPDLNGAQFQLVFAF